MFCQAILHALTSPKPHTRYYMANQGGIDAPIIAFIARVVPTYVIDWILLNL